jgi:hypothetical protein
MNHQGDIVMVKKITELLVQRHGSQDTLQKGCDEGVWIGHEKKNWTVPFFDHPDRLVVPLVPEDTVFRKFGRDCERVRHVVLPGTTRFLVRVR